MRNNMSRECISVGVATAARGPAQAAAARARGGGFTAPSHDHISAKKKLSHPEPFATNV